MNKRIKGEIFIIPNKSDCFVKQSRQTKKSLTNFYNVNNIEINESDDLISVWISSDDIDCENLSSHRIKYGDLEGLFADVHKLPAKIFAGKKEGDIITITLPYVKYMGCEIKETIEIELTLSQLKNRYRSFGTFENVLNEMI